MTTETTSGATNSPWTTSTSNDDVEELRKLHHEFVEANAVSDPGFLAAHMAPGPDVLTWFNLNGSDYVGVDHISELWQMIKGLLGDGRAESESSDERVTVEGDIGWVEFHLYYEADFGNLGKVAQHGRGTEIWRRVEGQWRMVHCHFSNHVPNQMGGY